VFPIIGRSSSLICAVLAICDASACLIGDGLEGPGKRNRLHLGGGSIRVMDRFDQHYGDGEAVGHLKAPSLDGRAQPKDLGISNKESDQEVALCE